MRATIFLSVILVAGCRSRPGVERDDLTWAVRNGKVAAVRTLLAQGADPNRPAGVNGWPPLMHAVHKNQIATAAALLELGADINKGAPEGMTPLMMAAGYGNDDMVEFLLQHHADAHVKTTDGAGALDFALTGVSDIDKFTLFRCQDSTVALLIRHHPDLLATTERLSRTFASLNRCSGERPRSKSERFFRNGPRSSGDALQQRAGSGSRNRSQDGSGRCADRRRIAP